MRLLPRQWNRLRMPQGLIYIKADFGITHRAYI